MLAMINAKRSVLSDIAQIEVTKQKCADSFGRSKTESQGGAPPSHRSMSDSLTTGMSCTWMDTHQCKDSPTPSLGLRSDVGAQSGI